MCIICYKDEGQPLPSMEQLENCWSNNDDGAGMAWWLPDEETWQVKKGFMTWDKFKAAYEAANFKPEQTVIIHFRTGTSGKGKGTNNKQTHPFPVTSRCRNMEAMTYKAKKIVFHNGIVGAGSDEYSDTMFGVRDYVYPLLKYINDDNIYILLGELWGIGRVIITDGFQIYDYGKWVIDEAGIAWSNDDYKEDKWAKWQAEATVYTSAWGGAYYKGEQINKHTTMFKDDYNSPFREENGLFNWEKWNKAERERAAAITTALEDPAESVAPTDVEDCEDDNTVVGMMDGDDFLNFDATYNEERVLKEFLMCPHCSEDKYLQESPFNQGDTICLVCGMVYDDPSGMQHFFDPDIHNGWREKKEEVA